MQPEPSEVAGAHARGRLAQAGPAQLQPHLAGLLLLAHAVRCGATCAGTRRSPQQTGCPE
eukprot:266454-Prymnesium_polylepis.1